MGYSEKIIDHYENPKNVGALDINDENVGTALVGAPSCGDVMKLQVKFGEDGKISETKFKTFGCASVIASSSVATECLKGKTQEEALSIKNTDIVKELSLPPVKIHCSVLAEDAIKAAIGDYNNKKKLKLYPVTIKDAALERVKCLMENDCAHAIRFSVKSGGCSGNKYSICLDEAFNLNDGHMMIPNKYRLNILIDGSSVETFKNCEIDYIKNDIEEKFIFNNPNAQNSCGCGVSFS